MLRTSPATGVRDGKVETEAITSAAGWLRMTSLVVDGRYGQHSSTGVRQVASRTLCESVE